MELFHEDNWRAEGIHSLASYVSIGMTAIAQIKWNVISSVMAFNKRKKNSW